MRRAIVYRGPTTYAAAVDICIEVETDFLYDNSDPIVKTLNEVVQQNYQSKEKSYNGNKKYGKEKGKEKRTCFHCKKVGHLKRDCWLIKKQNDRHHNSQEVEDIAAQTAEDMDDNINIFEHLLDNNQQEQADQPGRNWMKLPI
ncbi:hypothetical protein A0J61_10874 [Choanephora cucurbitarum]|uniref:CCHC-type domain-containing protein n=1 Tax=Choanephora cucurbitarum TaxID=101091 RepID=A0A1C7MXA4_9FUNG|nr:hypothetical protein A0J61_10874 [Choanephora cucurbitarum]